MTTFGKLLIQPYRASLPDLETPSGISRLREGSHDSCGLLADAIEEMIADTADDRERAAIERIEKRRAALEASTETISYMDFGAATRDSSQTAAEMYAGSPKTRTVGDLCQRTSKPYRSALLLFKLFRKFQPSVCLELGTCLGISGSYQAAALDINGRGRLVTLEGAEPVADLARETFESLGADKVTLRVGRFQDTLDDVLREYAPFDYAFIDGHHDEEPTIEYFEKIIPVLAPGALVLFDDIRWSDGMKRAWRRVVDYEAVRVSLDLVDIGICVMAPPLGSKEHFEIR
jgi:predicted O-methyltransferase YrrM